MLDGRNDVVSEVVVMVVGLCVSVVKMGMVGMSVCCGRVRVVGWCPRGAFDKLRRGRWLAVNRTVGGGGRWSTGSW